MKKSLTFLVAAAFTLTASVAYGQSVTLTDISKDDWFFQAVQNMQNVGIVKGFEDKTFRPNKELTRAEVTVLLDRMYGILTTAINQGKAAPAVVTPADTTHANERLAELEGILYGNTDKKSIVATMQQIVTDSAKKIDNDSYVRDQAIIDSLNMLQKSIIDLNTKYRDLQQMVSANAAKAADTATSTPIILPAQTKGGLETTVLGSVCSNTISPLDWQTQKACGKSQNDICTNMKNYGSSKGISQSTSFTSLLSSAGCS
jgi:hypothetical protein